MARNPHTTTIEDAIWNAFSSAVASKGKKINDVLEEFMQYYINNFDILATKKIQ